jgi:G3E family GTPase
VIIETSGVADPAPLINVLLGHPLVTAAYAFEATVCVVDAQHFLAARTKYPELDKQAALADRIVATKTDLADPAPALDFVRELNPGAEVCDSVVSLFSTLPVASAIIPISSLGPIRGRAHFSGIRAHAFRPAAGHLGRLVGVVGLAAAEFGARLIRVKGLLHMEDSGEIALVQGVQGVFHPPQRLREWPDADHGNRLVCIARDLSERDLAATLPALNTPAGTQAVYSMKELRERQERR